MRRWPSRNNIELPRVRHWLDWPIKQTLAVMLPIDSKQTSVAVAKRNLALARLRNTEKPLYTVEHGV